MTYVSRPAKDTHSLYLCLSVSLSLSTHPFLPLLLTLYDELCSASTFTCDLMTSFPVVPRTLSLSLSLS